MKRPVNRFNVKIIALPDFVCCLVMLVFISVIPKVVHAQEYPVSVLSAADTLTVLESGSDQPAVPSYGEITDWVSIHILKDQELSRYKSYIYSGMGFRLLYPAGYSRLPNRSTDADLIHKAKFPLLVFLHGMGEKGRTEENEAQLRYIGKAFLDAEREGELNSYALIPQSQTGIWSGYDLSKLSDIIDYMVLNNNVDPMRISLVGISSGADGAWRLAASHPELFSSLVSMSAALPEYALHIPRLLHLPVWIIQGSQDRNPAPADSKQLAELMTRSGCDVTYSLLKNTGHNTLVPMIVTKEFYSYIGRSDKLNPVRKGNQASVEEGFDGYKWFLDGKQIIDASSSSVKIRHPGSYAVSVYKNGVWSVRSPHALVAGQLL